MMLDVQSSATHADFLSQWVKVNLHRGCIFVPYNWMDGKFNAWLNKHFSSWHGFSHIPARRDLQELVGDGEELDAAANSAQQKIKFICRSSLHFSPFYSPFFNGSIIDWSDIRVACHINMLQDEVRQPSNCHSIFLFDDTFTGYYTWWNNVL